MSLLQDYYPAIRDGKTVYVRIDLLTKDDVFANCSRMTAASTKLCEQFQIDSGMELLKHEEQLREFHSKTPEEGF